LDIPRISDENFQRGKTLKPSHYNFLVQVNEKNHIFNTNSKCVLPLDIKDYSALIKLLKTQLNDSKLDGTLSDLANLGYFVEDVNTEISSLIQNKKTFIENNDQICLTIMMTNDCNLRCVYCYQNHKRNHLEGEDLEKVKKFINEIVKNKKIVNILYFGGEPLLNTPAIEKLHFHTEELSKIHDFQYNPKISTNGYSIDKNISLFEKINFKTIRISLDGSEERHDQLRRTKNNGCTFRRILDNIISLKSPNVMIRVNIDSDSQDYFENLCKTLMGIKFQGKLIIDKIESNCMDGRCSTKQIKDYSSYINIAGKYNLDIARPFTPRAVRCLFEVGDSFLITPESNLYKCFISKDTRVGKINKNGTISADREAHKNASRWKQSTDNIERCKHCKILPICGGGCAAKKLTAKNYCPIWKTDIKSLIETTVKLPAPSTR